jgi:L-serine/L-threonine ammonia-lyase
MFADDHRVIVEPACGASLALLYKNSEVLKGFENILVIVCGGVAVSYRELIELRETLVTRN